VPLEQSNYDAHAPETKVEAVRAVQEPITDQPRAKGLKTADDFK